MRRERWLPFRRRALSGKHEDSGSPGSVLLADVHGQRDEADTEFATEWDDLSGVEVVDGEFVIVTADKGAPAHHEPISRLLQQVRARTGMDVVYVSQFMNGKRLVRHAAADPRDPHGRVEGSVDPLEATFCQRVLDGRLPAALPDARSHPEASQLAITTAWDIRAHVAAPIMASDGRVFGTVCAYAHGPRQDPERAFGVVKEVARVLARALEHAEQD